MDNTSQINICDIKKHIADGFFIIETTSSKLIFAKCTSDVFEGNRVMMEVTIQNTGTLSVVFGGTQVQMISIGLKPCLNSGVSQDNLFNPKQCSILSTKKHLALTEQTRTILYSKRHLI